ncbi:hypothetical protein [Proteiniclasticum sp.]|uniref:hypothetical protein n=1 Tax=Proteiniclasticum sp. TaxID=2053595 RepID=UPI00289FD6BD|nr:hypothetical protein [Proteiniclasticum sp.]
MKTEKIKQLMNWYDTSMDKAINMKTVPYMGIEPVKDLVKKILYDGGRVLYITGEDKEKVLIVRVMREAGFESISVHQEMEINEMDALVICDYFQALRVRGEYDLVIYDDVNSFPIHKKPEMQQLIGFIFPKCRKVIAYSFETVFMGMEVIEVPMAGRSGFISEPRILETRLNLDEFVPTSVYEYLLWFVIEKKKVLFLTSNKKVKKKVARFLSKIDESLESSIYDVDEIGTMKMKELCMDGTKAHIFITDDLDDYLEVESNLEIIIHGSDSARYSYRELIFFCLRSGYYDELNGEVIMLCQSVTRDMEKTRDLARHFNKVLWDEGFE